MRKLSTAAWKQFRQIAADTAGCGRAGLVLRALKGKVWVDPNTPRSSLHFDNIETFTIDRLVLGSPYCFYTMIHEFGHAYHAYYWPVLTALMVPPCARAEAVALLFELELQVHAEARYIHRPPKHMPEFIYMATSTWQARLKTLRTLQQENPEPFDLLEGIVDTAPRDQDFHTLVERIVNSDGS